MSKKIELSPEFFLFPYRIIFNYLFQIDSQAYECRGDVDSGGVHINSAVINRMYSSLVDGRVVEGITIEPIGLTKAFYIYTAAQLMYQDPFTSNAHWFYGNKSIM